MAITPSENHTYHFDSDQPRLLSGGITTFALATIFLFLRALARRLQKLSFWWDDWLILIAWLSNAGFIINFIYGITQDAIGLHEEELTEDQKYAALRDLFVADIFYTVSLFLIKLSVLAFYWRIFHSISDIRLPIKILAVIVGLWFIGRMPPIFLRCFPLRGYWDPSVPTTCHVDIAKYFLGTITVHLVIDITLYLLPIPFIRKLKINQKQKLGIYFIFAVGGFICSCSIVQLVAVGRLNSSHSDGNFYTAWVMMWAAVEINMTAVAACLPSLRPIYTWLTGRLSRSGEYADDADKTNVPIHDLKTISIGNSEHLFKANSVDSLK